MASVNVMGQVPSKVFNKEVDFDTDTIKIMLLTSSASPDIDTDIYIDDLSGDEISGTGYTSGGATLSNKAVTYDSATNTTKFDGDDVVWTTSTFSTRYGVIYVDTGTPSTSVVLAYIDFDSEQSTSSSDFTIQFHADGIFTITV